MPSILVAQVRFTDGKWILYNIDEIIKKFPFCESSLISGKIISVNLDGRIKKINKGFKFHLTRENDKIIGWIIDPNPLKNQGLPLPSDFLIIIYSYEKKNEEFPGEAFEYPIVEGTIIKIGSIYGSFEDDSKRILQEEEAGFIIEGVIFNEELKEIIPTIKIALLGFEQERYPDTKTSCRKVLERIQQIIGNWSEIDNSSSICDKSKSIINSLKSFASIGGPHEGVTTREETELILKNTVAILIYINSILKNLRYKISPLQNS